ncbi:hypothetical protein BDN72DRAFT_621872 [Pluteus cervinus]|uniref:Uncharacterized protein n=1 Tax=Pluteus cervinus TaxID=181527 RepID=A0ACD3AV93_9AGAR|nr:hypothetical protein BDN72DRAFT_621872 [Pluteus cervinus]
MLGNMPFEVVGLVAVWLELLLHGVYSVIFFESLYMMHLRRKGRLNIARLYMAGSIVMYLIATTHLGIATVRVFRGYVYLPPSMSISDGHFAQYYVHWEHSLFNALHASTVWVAEVLLIYRCYTLWDRTWYVIVVPIICFCGSVAANVPIFLWWLQENRSGMSIVETSVFFIYPLSLAQNLVTSTLIIIRLLPRFQQSRRLKQSNRIGVKVVHAIRIVFESAVLYTLELFVIVVLLLCRHNGAYILLGMVVPTVGIAFNFIAVSLHFLSVSPQAAAKSYPSFVRPPDQMASFDPMRFASPLASPCSLSSPARKPSAVSGHSGTGLLR